MYITSAIYYITDDGLSIDQSEVIAETAYYYYAHKGIRYPKNSLGKPELHSASKYPYVMVAMVDADEATLRAKLREWFVAKANEICPLPATATPAQTSSDPMMDRILRFIKEEDLDTEICRVQLAALWTSYCLLNDYECDTAHYDNALLMIYEEIQKHRVEDVLVAGIEHYEWPESFEIFDDWMCADLV